MWEVGLRFNFGTKLYSAVICWVNIITFLNKFQNLFTIF